MGSWNDKWQKTLNVKEETKQSSNGELPSHELAGIMAARLKALYPNTTDGELEEVIERFEGIAADKDDSVDEFNQAMEELYDWGDYGKRLWIDTNFS